MKADKSLLNFPRHAGLALVACGLVVSVQVAAAAEEKQPLGAQAASWLELQKAQKPKPDEGISGEQATLIWERHIQSFGREIPETLHDKSSISSGGAR